MKTCLFFLALLLAGTTTAYAQKINASQVPAAVRMAFEARFPAAQAPAWSKETRPVRSEYEYETHGDFRAREAFLAQEAYGATFQLRGRTMSVIITPTGLIQETETEVAVQALRAAVRATLGRDFEANEIKEAAPIVRADGRTVCDAEPAPAGRKPDVRLTADGRQAPQ